MVKDDQVSISLNLHRNSCLGYQSQSRHILILIMTHKRIPIKPTAPVTNIFNYYLQSKKPFEINLKGSDYN